ncbi:MAG TPA: AraD1 family protein [Gammaproteobacteria bacterium]|nr:AraD1 family protein [Gammaproteobacteria bacterium]
MRLIQFKNTKSRPAVGVVDGAFILPLQGVNTTYELALAAISKRVSVESLVTASVSGDRLDYQELIDRGCILSPFGHPDPAQLLVSGTGLTHLGSADTRDAMHRKLKGSAETELSDSMKMFRLGIEGGKPAPGKQGVQPEWFYKGDGTCVAAPYTPLRAPAFALDGGEEPEIVGLYVLSDDGTPYRLGFTLGNEFSDHVMERQNYLYLAHSKLRACSFGPEILLGELPKHVAGTSRIIRNGQAIWEKPFLSGEDNMCHSIANLEAHHFKYRVFRRPGAAHVHFFGTATLSFGDGIKTRHGDIFEIESPLFGRPLRNELLAEEDREAGGVRAL